MDILNIDFIEFLKNRDDPEQMESYLYEKYEEQKSLAKTRLMRNLEAMRANEFSADSMLWVKKIIGNPDSGFECEDKDGVNTIVFWVSYEYENNIETTEEVRLERIPDEIYASFKDLAGAADWLKL